jgi:hypothetical protein
MRKHSYIVKIDHSPPVRKNKKKSKTTYVKREGEEYNITSNNNFLKDTCENKIKTVIGYYKPNIKKKKKKNNIDKKIKIKDPIMTVNYTNKFYNYANKMKSSNSTDKFNNYNKRFITS